MTLLNQIQPAPTAAGNTSKSTDEARVPEATVDPVLLYPYVCHRQSYGAWFSNARTMSDIAYHPELPEYRGIVNINGNAHLTLQFAKRLASSDSSLASAIANIAIQEYHDGAATGNPASVNDTLRRFFGIVAAGNVSDPRSLHEFLEIPEDYDSWIASQIKELKMKRDRNYIRLPNGTQTPDGADMVLSFHMAQEIALRGKTPRCEQVRQCMEQLRRSLSGIGPSTWSVVSLGPDSRGPIEWRQG